MDDLESRVDHLEVSIRSPHRSEGRYVKTRVVVSNSIVFQSAPLTGVRGDRYDYVGESEWI